MPAVPLIIGAVIGAGTAAYQAKEARKAQARAMDEARREAAKPGPQSARSAIRPGVGMPMPGAAGNGTLLTGPSGIAPSSVSLGKNTLLGE